LSSAGQKNLRASYAGALPLTGLAWNGPFGFDAKLNRSFNFKIER